MNATILFPKRRGLRPALLLAAAFLLGAAGCGTTKPARFFQLNAPAAPPPPPAEPAWCVKSVKLPRYLDRSQMVLRRSPHEVALDEYNRWAEPLEDGIARVLMAGRRNPAEPTWQVEIDVILLDARESGTAVLEAGWSARPPRGGAPVNGTFRKTRNTPGTGPERGPATLSVLVTELGDAITEALGRQAAGP